MKIAWISYDFEEYSAVHVNALAQHHDVLLVMPQLRGVEYPLDKRICYYNFEKPRLRQPIRQWSSIRAILQRVHEFQPDVVHYQQGHLWFNAALGSLKQYPLVITIHDPRHHAGDVVSQKTPQWVMDYGFRKADHAIVHGEALAPQVNELFGLSERRIHVIPHVAMGQTNGTAVAEEEPFTVLFFGRIWDYKGLDYLIKAEPHITSVIPEAKIVVAGEGEDFTKYQQLIGDSSRFEIHNRWISDEERTEFFQRASLVVLPYNEATQSGVVPVAQTYAKAVVATRVGALAECVHDEVTGLLVEPRNPQALADAIVRLLSNPVERQQMGEAGKAVLEQQCSPEVVASQTIAVYQAAVEDFANDSKLAVGVG